MTVPSFMLRLILAFLLLCSCSNLSKNTIYEGTFDVKSGVHQNVSWEDALVFKRTSWFQEATLLFDLMLVSVDSGSPFYHWFSSDEKSLLGQCEKNYVVLAYALNSKKLSNREFVAQAEDSGFEEIKLPSFKSHLSLHPVFTRQSLRLYKVYGLCQKKAAIGQKKLIVRFPGYREVVIP